MKIPRLPLSIKLILVFGCTSAFYIFIFATMAASYAGNNPLNKLNRDIVQYVSIFPQGWAFFTKSPREGTISLYQVKNDRLEKIDLRGFKQEYFFGSSRKSRVFALETSNVLKKLNRTPDKVVLEKTINFRDDLNDHIETASLTFNKIEKDQKNILLEGQYLLVIEDFLPWSLLSKKNTFTIKQHVKLIPFEIG
jgi:antimicrobial peptide system SdpA family protein